MVRANRKVTMACFDLNLLVSLWLEVTVYSKPQIIKLDLLFYTHYD